MNDFCTTLRSRSANGFLDGYLRLVAAILLAFVVPILASGYTIVMRGGHRIDVPDEFQLTATTLTYEASVGIMVTMQLSSIDIVATDKANGSRPGTLLGRLNQVNESRKSPLRKSATVRATRTLTNLDLEPSRVRRLESEAAYDSRRKELGLPSREESDRVIQAESERARQSLARSEIERAEAETYWRTRASSLRNEIFVLESEIEYLRLRLAEMPESAYSVSFAGLGRTVPFVLPGTPMNGPGLVVRGQTSAQTLGTVSVPQTQFGMRPRVSLQNSFDGGATYRRRFNRCLYAPCAQTFVLPYYYNYSSMVRTAILGRYEELATARAGFQERWRILEDEARRAGAQPGWLRQ